MTKARFSVISHLDVESAESKHEQKTTNRKDFRSCEAMLCEAKDHLMPFPDRNKEKTLFLKFKNFVCTHVSSFLISFMKNNTQLILNT